MCDVHAALKLNGQHLIASGQEWRGALLQRLSHPLKDLNFAVAHACLPSRLMAATFRSGSSPMTRPSPNAVIVPAVPSRSPLSISP